MYRPNNVKQDTFSTIRRAVPRCPGIDVKGNVCGVDVWFTIDTGASLTIVSKCVFDENTA